MDMTLKTLDIADSKAWFWSKFWFEIRIILTAPFVLWGIPREWSRIPDDDPRRYYQCYHYGLDGDPYWKAKHGAAVKSWWRRVLWCWRNANYLDNEQGVRAADIVRVEAVGERRVGNHPYVPGELAIHAWDKNDRRYWCYYTVKRGWLPGRCNRSVYGWKLKDILDEQDKDGILGNDPNVRQVLQRVHTWNPVMGYSE